MDQTYKYDSRFVRFAFAFDEIVDFRLSGFYFEDVAKKF